MDLEEFKERYRALPLTTRLFWVTLICLLPVAFYYWDRVSTIDETLEAVRASHESARIKFERANKAFENRGQLEEQRVIIEEQLTKARAKLPDNFNVDQFLRKATMIGQEAGIELRIFDPEEERCGNSVVNHKELPINFELLGKFSQIASFMDRLVHLDMSVTIDKVKMQAAASEEKAETASEEALDVDAIRRDFRIKSNFSVLLYKSVAVEGECAGQVAPPASADPANASPSEREAT